MILLAMVLLALPVLAACSSGAAEPDATVDDPLGIDGDEVTLEASDPGAAEVAGLDPAVPPYFTGSASGSFPDQPVPEGATRAEIEIGVSQVVLTPPVDAEQLPPTRITIDRLVFDDLVLNDGVTGYGIAISLSNLDWRFDRGECLTAQPCAYDAVDEPVTITLENADLAGWQDVLDGGLPSNTYSASVFLEFEEELSAESATLTLSAPKADVFTTP
jgi:hypothetical protein